MIRVGIIGGSNPMAGELIRLLINHPDVEIIWVNSARYAGRLVSDVHHGLIGETALRISAQAPLDTVNALFIFRNQGQTLEWLAEREIPDDLRIIDLSIDMRQAAAAAEHGFVYGLPELNRKPMVRGARRAVVPHPAAATILLALLPIAKEHEVGAEIKASVSTPGLAEKIGDTESLRAEVLAALAELQPGVESELAVSRLPESAERVMEATVEIATRRDIGELTRMYEEFYDDHNFVFVVSNGRPDAKEVEGTNKCLIYLDKHDGMLTVSLMMDSLLKGAAGTAVHDMNLLFGLHERVGLTLKASRY